MMKAMLRFIASARFATALVLGASSFACGDDGEKEPPVEQEPGPSTGSTCPSDQTLTYENFGRDFFESYCTRCHSSELSGSDRHGAPVGYDWDDIEAVRAHTDLIDKMAAAGPDATNMSMPPTDPRPTLTAREQLGEWLVCGAP
jgi:cytochrome c5